MLKLGLIQLGLDLDPSACQKLIAYAALVMKWNQTFNLTGAVGVDEFIKDHILDCLAARQYLSGPRVLDVGSGAGLPGIPLAIVTPAVHYELIESRGKRCRFLVQAKIELELSNVEVVQVRVEEHAPSVPFDIITCRAFASLSQFFEATRRLHHRRCRLVALKAAVDQREFQALDDIRVSYRTIALDVPERAGRQVVILECH